MRHMVYDQHQRFAGAEGMLQNVTERLRSEEKLPILLWENRSLMLHWMQVQEEERHMLAWKPHDELRRLPTGIGMRVEA